MKYSFVHPAFLLAAAVLIFSGCALDSQSALPSWAQGPTRNVDNGYIVYIESADDLQSEKASWLAESAALKDLQNECTFIPKGARVEDKFDYHNENVHQVFVKVAIEQQVCDEAKLAQDPETIQKLANVPMTEQVKQYQEMQEKPTPETKVAEDDSVPSEGGSATPASVNIDNDTDYFVARERVVRWKETIILPPPVTPPVYHSSPASPPMVALPPTHKPPVFTSEEQHHLEEQMKRLQRYEFTHPELKKSPKVWTQVHHDFIRPTRTARRAPLPFEKTKYVTPENPRPVKKKKWRKNTTMY